VKKIRTLIVDDEPLAREGLRNLLLHDQEIDIIGECSDGIQAVETIRATRPDLVLLDIQMPEVDGFDVIRQVGVGAMPTMIFVTAYDEYALQAFDVHALDYVLKPVDPERFARSIARAKETLSRQTAGEMTEKLNLLLQGLDRSLRSANRIMVRNAGRIYFVRTEEIDWIEADGDYVRLHAASKNHLVREKIGDLEKRLDPSEFIRIHRSTMVRIGRIKELQPLFSGDYMVTLHDGRKLPLSRTYRDKVLDTLGQKS
jgi:two-component system LytT family response regulator